MSVVPIKPPELMEGKFEDFIGVWENHMPKFVCDKIIDKYESFMVQSTNNLESCNQEVTLMDGTNQFPNRNLGRKDTSIMFNQHASEESAEINQYLHACFLDYTREYPQLNQGPLISTDVKAQKTMPSGGYHVWHSENSSYLMAQRVLVWAIYLNDIEEGGETEFLYQSVRLKPKVGTCVIWPAAFTHLHRGNPPLKQNKYIVTGWYINAAVSR